VKKKKSVSAISLGLSIRKRTYLGRVENSLYLLQETALILLELGLGLHGALDEQFDIPELAEVEIALTLQTLNSLLKCVVLLCQSGGLRTTS
jgi:hypothetical protein